MIFVHHLLKTFSEQKSSSKNCKCFSKKSEQWRKLINNAFSKDSLSLKFYPSCTTLINIITGHLQPLFYKLNSISFVKAKMCSSWLNSWFVARKSLDEVLENTSTCVEKVWCIFMYHANNQEKTLTYRELVCV